MKTKLKTSVVTDFHAHFARHAIHPGAFSSKFLDPESVAVLFDVAGPHKTAEFFRLLKARDMKAAFHFFKDIEDQFKSDTSVIGPHRLLDAVEDSLYADGVFVARGGTVHGA